MDWSGVYFYSEPCPAGQEQNIQRHYECIEERVVAMYSMTHVVYWGGWAVYWEMRQRGFKTMLMRSQKLMIVSDDVMSMTFVRDSHATRQLKTITVVLCYRQHITRYIPAYECCWRDAFTTPNRAHHVPGSILPDKVPGCIVPFSKKMSEYIRFVVYGLWIIKTKMKV